MLKGGGKINYGNQQLRQIMEGLPVATYTCDTEGRITFFNRASAKLWGREPELGKDLWCGSWKIFTADGQRLPLDECPMAVTLREGKAISGAEILIERPDGERFNVLANPQPIFSRAGELAGAVNMLIDITERKKNEDTLALSEKRYRTIVEGQLEMVSRFRPDGTLLFVNRAYARSRGMSQEALLKSNFWDFIAEKDRGPVRAMLEQLSPESPEVRIENRFETAQGTRWTLWHNCALEFDEEGRAIEVQSSGIDISDRKLVEMRLGAEHAVSRVLNSSESMDEAAPLFLEALCHHLEMDIGELWLPTPDRREIRCPHVWTSDSIAAHSGQWKGLTTRVQFGAGEELPGIVWEDKVPRRLTDIFSGRPSPRTELAARLGITSNMAFPLLIGDECVGVVCLHGKRKLILDELLEESLSALGYDIAQFMLLEARNTQQRVTAELGQRALAATGLQEVFDTATSAVAETLGVELCKVLELLPGGDAMLLRAGIGWREGLVGHATVDTSMNSQAGYTLLSASPVIINDLRTETRFNGPPFLVDHGVVSGMSCIINGPQGRPWGVLGAHTQHRRTFTAHDIAFLQGVANLLGSAIQRAAAEDALQQANETLEERVSERTAELEELSNRLRVLANKLSESEQNERKRLAALLHDHLQQLLVAARMRLSNLSSQPMDKGLAESTSSAIEILNQALEESRTLTAELRPPALYESGLTAGLTWLAGWMDDKYGLTVELDSTLESEPPVDSHGAFIFESVRELLFNAVKHADTDRVTVSLRNSPGEGIVVTVKDEGTGFDPDDARPKDKNGNLGLFSIRERLHLLGGTLDIMSAPGKGTEVKIQLPFTDASPGETMTIASPTGPAFVQVATSSRPAPIRLLLADDHDVVRQGIAMLLDRSADIEVIAEVDDGRKAVITALQLQPDVIILDVNMPNMNGIEAAREIGERVPHARIIGLSVQVDHATRQAMLDAGANAFFAKDGPAEELIAGIRKLATESNRPVT